MKSLAVVGVGNIGWRHLEAALKVAEITEVHCIEPRVEMLRARIDSMPLAVRGKIADVVPDLQAFRKCRRHVDFFISAVTTDVQERYFPEYFDFKPSAVMLEKPLAQSRVRLEEMAALASIHGASAQVCVNCSRDLWTGFADLKAKLAQRPDEQRVVIEVTGQLWGLGCNALHFLELFRHLTGCARINHLHTVIGASPQGNKRGNQFEEFCGCMSFSSESGDGLVLISSGGAGMEQPPLLLVRDARTGELLYSVEEHLDRVTDIEQLRETRLGMQYVSQSTADVLGRLALGGESGLPALKDILVPHHALFDALEFALQREQFAIT